MQRIGKSKIGSLSARKGVSYPQLRLPQQYADVIGDMADIFETEREGKRAFLIVTERTMSNNDNVLKQNANVLKQCADVAQTSTDDLCHTSDSIKQSAAPGSSKSTVESFIINPLLVSCALCNHHFCASPGSVAAYHGALSRLRLGFKSRLGRSFFAFF